MSQLWNSDRASVDTAYYVPDADTPSEDGTWVDQPCETGMDEPEGRSGAKGGHLGDEPQWRYSTGDTGDQESMSEHNSETV